MGKSNPDPDREEISREEEEAVREINPDDVAGGVDNPGQVEKNGEKKQRERNRDLNPDDFE